MLGDDPPSSPLASFDYYCDVMDEEYGGFLTKTIDWNVVRTMYRSQLEADNSDEKLYNVLKDICDILNDGHMKVLSPFGSYPMLSPSLIDTNLICSKYLAQIKFGSNNFFCGDISSTIGYMHIGSFSSSGGFSLTGDFFSYPSWLKDFGGVMDRFAGKRYLVIDMRDNYGGDELCAQEFVSYFIPGNITPYTEYIKNGPGHFDFSSKLVTIGSKHQTAVPQLIVLVGSSTESSADIVSVLLRYHANARFIGNSNVLSFIGNSYPRELPNGWAVSFGSINTVFTANSLKDGDVFNVDDEVSNTLTDISSGKDTQLDAAILYADMH